MCLHSCIFIFPYPHRHWVGIYNICWNTSCCICIQRWASPLQLACSLTKDGFHSSWVIDLVSQSLNCLTNASPLFPFISFPASQISHLRPWEIQYLICEVYCLAEWKAVDATDNCYRQKDNYRSFGALSKRMTCLCWFRFKSSDVLYAVIVCPFSLGAFIWCLIWCHKHCIKSKKSGLGLLLENLCTIKVGKEPAASFPLTDEGLWAIMADWYIWIEKGTTSALSPKAPI